MSDLVSVVAAAVTPAAIVAIAALGARAKRAGHRARGVLEKGTGNTEHA
jgi:hypothetical protein